MAHKSSYMGNLNKSTNLLSCGIWPEPRYVIQEQAKRALQGYVASLAGFVSLSKELHSGRAAPVSMK